MVNIRTAVFLLLAVGLSAGQNEGKQEEREPMAKENRETITLFGIEYSVNHVACVGGAAAVGAATAVGVPALLGAIGFGPIGVIAGSLAALVQSLMGNVVAGSMFASLQSLAMTGGASSATAQALIGSALACGCLVQVG